MRCHRPLSMIAFALILVSLFLLSTGVPRAGATDEPVVTLPIDGTVIYLPLLIGPGTPAEEHDFAYWQAHPLEARREVIRLVNIERVASGCSAAVENPILMDATQAWAEYMSATTLAQAGGAYMFVTTLAHTSSYPGDWYDEHGWPHFIMGENIAGNNEPYWVVHNWMNSPGHRAAMLACDAGPDYRYEIGVGYVDSWILTISAE